MYTLSEDDTSDSYQIRLLNVGMSLLTNDIQCLTTGFLKYISHCGYFKQTDQPVLGINVLVLLYSVCLDYRHPIKPQSQ